jgi:hypothetical protein
MGAQIRTQPQGWTIEGAERLLTTLTGVLSARVVAKAGGEIEEIHVLTSEEISPKQTVRNVESALLAHFDLTVDHRRISVAQTKASILPLHQVETVISPRGGGLFQPLPGQPLPGASEPRILFAGHETESGAHRVKMRVAVEWNGETFTGEATGTDLPRTRLEIVAEATLRSIETAVNGPEAERDPLKAKALSLSLDGVKMVEAFERDYVMVGVHAITPRKLTVLVGACPVEESPDRATIMATLQAADRWVRGRAHG